MRQYIYLLAIASLVGCAKQKNDKNRDRTPRISRQMTSRLLLDTVKLDAAFTLTQLNGRIQTAEDKLVHIFPMVSGIAASISIQQGDQVKKNQLLATLQSPEIAGLTKDAIISKTNLSNAKRAMDIAEDLYKTGLYSLKEVELLRGEYQKSLAEDHRNRVVLQMNKGGQQQSYEIRSPLSGFVVDKNISSGTQVRSDNAQSLFTIADLSTVNVVFDIYESDIANIHQDDSIKITTISYPDRVFEGKIEKIYNQLDQESTVMKARASISNPDFILKPGMFANVQVKRHLSNRLPFINANDIVFDHNLNYVLVLEPSGNIRIQRIELGKRIEDKIFILAGVKQGERLIASRQVYYYQALKK